MYGNTIEQEMLLFFIGRSLSYFPVNETAVKTFLNATSFLIRALSNLIEILQKTSKVPEKRLRRQIKHAENKTDFQVNMAIFHIMLTYRTSQMY